MGPDERTIREKRGKARKYGLLFVVGLTLSFVVWPWVMTEAGFRGETWAAIVAAVLMFWWMAALVAWFRARRSLRTERRTSGEVSAPPPPRQEGSIWTRRRPPNRRLVVLGVLILLSPLFLGLAAFLSDFLPKDCGADVACFTDRATALCQSADLAMTDDAGTSWRLRVRKKGFDRCAFTKTLLVLDPAEGEPLKRLLEGKSLACEFPAYAMDTRLVTSAFWGIEECSGELKEGIGQLLFLAQLR